MTRWMLLEVTMIWQVLRRCGIISHKAFPVGRIIAESVVDIETAQARPSINSEDREEPPSYRSLSKIAIVTPSFSKLVEFVVQTQRDR